MNNFHCFNTNDRAVCNFCNKSGDLKSELDQDLFCPCDNSKLKLMGTTTASITGLRTENNLAQRRVRNHKHFRKEVLPSIKDVDIKRIHEKKLGINTK
jgi:hypothetical protein